MLSHLDVDVMAPRLRAEGAALVDVDNDLDLDVLLLSVRAPMTTSGIGVDSIYINDGSGHFVNETPTRMPIEATMSRHRVAAVGDFDGDGRCDIVAIGHQRAAEIYLNKGGRFTFLNSFGDLRSATAGVAVSQCLSADLDGDGNQDLLSISPTGFSKALHNTGGLSFSDETDNWIPAIKSLPLLFAAYSDINQDGRADILAVDSGRSGNKRVFLFINIGSGRYVDESASRVPSLSVAGMIDVADVNGDDNLDIYVASDVPGAHELLLNNGAGYFGLAPKNHLPGFSEGTYFGRFVDLDGDGDRDILVGVALRPAASSGPYCAVLENDGSGRFSVLSSGVPYMAGPTGVPQIGDLDLDGDDDLLLPDPGWAWSEGTRVWWNLTRQLVIGRKGARIGGVAYEEFMCRSCVGNGGAAVPWFGVRRLPSPLVVSGLGMVWLDPAAILVGAVQGVDPTTGYSSTALPVPYDFRLIGTTLFSQGIIWNLAGLGRIELTGVWSAKVAHDRF